MREVPASRASVDFLLKRVRKLRGRLPFAHVMRMMKTPANDAERRTAIVFSVCHLLFSGAVAEENLARYLDGEPLPDRIAKRSHPDDPGINLLAWQGKALNDSQDLIGAIVFLVVLLFFFEAYPKLDEETRLELLGDLLGLFREIARLANVSFP